MLAPDAFAGRLFSTLLLRHSDCFSKSCNRVDLVEITQQDFSLHCLRGHVTFQHSVLHLPCALIMCYPSVAKRDEKWDLFVSMWGGKQNIGRCDSCLFAVTQQHYCFYHRLNRYVSDLFKSSL